MTNLEVTAKFTGERFRFTNPGGDVIIGNAFNDENFTFTIKGLLAKVNWSKAFHIGSLVDGQITSQGLDLLKSSFTSKALFAKNLLHAKRLSAISLNMEKALALDLQRLASCLKSLELKRSRSASKILPGWWKR